MRQLTLNFFLKDGQILLAMKKRGFGVGKWNGYGGKCQEGESIEQAAVREIEEESNITISGQQLIHKGKLKFYFPFKPEWDQEVHIFVIEKWEGNPTETEEMKPQWFSFSEIPYDVMWKDDLYWLPLVLEGHTITGQFTFGATNEEIDHWEVHQL